MRTTAGLTDSATVVTTREYASRASASAGGIAAGWNSVPEDETKKGLLLISLLDREGMTKDSWPAEEEQPSAIYNASVADLKIMTDLKGKTVLITGAARRLG